MSAPRYGTEPFRGRSLTYRNVGRRSAGHVLRVAGAPSGGLRGGEPVLSTDGAAGALGLGQGSLRLPLAVARDVVAGMLGRRPVTVSSTGTSDSPGLMSTTDVAPPRATLRHVRRVPHVELHHDPAGHVDFPLGEAFERLVARQDEFLARPPAVPA